jgi:hypothetical protein
VTAFFHRLLDSMFGPVVDSPAWAVSRLDVWDGKGN